MELLVENIHKRRGIRKVLKGVTIKIIQGEVVGLFGANGSGKTTLLSVIVGLLRQERGKIFLGQEDISFLKVHHRALKGISYLSQEPSVFQTLTVEQNLESVLEWRNDLSREQKDSRKENVIQQLHLQDFIYQKAGALSGGQRRRTEVARALMRDPLFFLLDEPFSGVDPKSVMEMIQILYTLKDLGMGILITDHHIQAALKVAERAYIFHEGTILAAGSKEELTNNEDVREFYLGEDFQL